MGLLQEIRDLASDDTAPVERVLLRCMVLADILGDENLMRWVAQELDGYPKRSELPDYRIGRGQARARVTNGVRYEEMVIAEIQLPPEATWDDYARLNAIYFTDGVRELEANEGAKIATGKITPLIEDQRADEPECRKENAN